MLQLDYAIIIIIYGCFFFIEHLRTQALLKFDKCDIPAFVNMHLVWSEIKGTLYNDILHFCRNTNITKSWNKFFFLESPTNDSKGSNDGHKAAFDPEPNELIPAVVWTATYVQLTRVQELETKWISGKFTRISNKKRLLKEKVGGVAYIEVLRSFAKSQINSNLSSDHSGSFKILSPSFKVFDFHTLIITYYNLIIITAKYSLKIN